MSAVVPVTFGNMIEIVESRGKIAGEVQDTDRDFIKAVLNEYNQMISVERSWPWRKENRTLNFNEPITTGTVAVLNGSRVVTFTGLTVSNSHLGRTLKFNNERELHRVIGIKTSTNQMYLDGNYVGEDNATATYSLYQYEFPLPPDCDFLDMVHIDTGGVGYSGKEDGQLDYRNVLEFNRWLSVASDLVGPPTDYNRDGKIFFSSLPPLDEMILDYDFLGGDDFSKVDCLRLWPIAPDRDTLVHMNYTKLISPLVDDDQEPLIPRDHRWILVHYALAEWFAHNDSISSSEREFSKGDAKLAEMRQKYAATDAKPKMIGDGTQFMRSRSFGDYKLRHKMSRIGEAS